MICTGEGFVPEGYGGEWEWEWEGMKKVYVLFLSVSIVAPARRAALRAEPSLVTVGPRAFDPMTVYSIRTTRWDRIVCLLESPSR